jgi:ankyrin repeat protein
MAIVFLVSITLVLTVMLRQNAVKRVKAPIWFPPPLNDNGNNTLEMKKANTYVNAESSTWSLAKKFDDFTNIFRTNPSTKSKSDDMSPPSCIDEEEDNDYGEYESKSKMRKLDAPIYTVINHSNSSTCSSKSTNTTTPSLMLFPSNNTKSHTPDYYPSPPESLPDILNPINYKSNGLTPLMLFIMNRSKAKHSQNGTKDDLINETEIIDSFILNGADLNTTNLDGETVLHLAARCGLHQIFDRLLKTGRDLNAYDSYGRNVLHTAVCSNEYEIVKLILEHCSNSISVNQQILDDRLDLIDSKTNDDLGDTALIIAARLNLNTVLKLLIDYNATVNATDNEGRSALHWCAKVNNFNGAMLLLQAGANVNMQDNDERTPLTSALSELCTKEVADLLIKYDAFVSSEDEAKYKKMKTVLEQLNMLDVNVQQKLQENFQLVKTTNANTYKENNLLVKSNNLNKVTNVSVSTSTKRKYSESCATENKSNTLTSKKKSAVNKTEPQVVNHVQQPQYTNEYQQQQEYNSYYSNLNSYNNGYNSYPAANNVNSYHNQQQQQYNFHHNPAFSYNSSSNDSIENLDGPVYHSDASKMNGYYNTNTLSNPQIYHHLTNQQSTQNNNFSNSTNLYFTTNETYAAYF